jgi:CelD/BcsL family acetyltransferase involved in cellulose biosynthesis
MELELVTTTGAFAGLKEEWNALLARSSTRHIFLTHEWQYTWWEHFGSGDEGLLILLVRDQGRLVGIAPLRRDRLTLKGIPVLRQLTFLLGYEADYRDLLLEEGKEWEVLGEMLTYLREQVQGWDLLALRGIRGSSPVKDLLPSLSGLQGLSCHGEIGVGCPFIPLPSTYAEFAQSLSGGVRREYGRKLRALEKREGSFTLTAYQGDAMPPEAFEEFLRLHRLSWQGRGGTHALHSEKVVEFHRSLLERMRPTQTPIIMTLSTNGQGVSVLYGYVQDGVFYDYLPGHDPAFQQYSPGIQMVLQAAEYCIEQGWTELDLMRGEESYKFNFTHHVRHLHNHFVARKPSTLRRARIVEGLAAR